MSTDGDRGARRLGDFIRMQRQMADLSLRRMADLTQVSNAYLSQVERGLHQPSIRVLRSIAEALNMSADTLLAQAGLLDNPPEGTHLNATEAAIRNDPRLRPADKDALIRVYQSLRQAEPEPASGTAPETAPAAAPDKE
jgi:transcriptional regulator with XRE-family HTH domain